MCSLAQAERLMRSAGALLLLLSGVSLTVSLLSAIGPAPSTALVLVFLGGSLVFGVLGGLLLVSAPRSGTTHRSRRENRDEPAP